MRNIYCVVCGKYEKLKNLIISYILQKSLVSSIICIKCASKYGKIFKEEESIEVLEILGLIDNIEQYQKVWLKKK